ncbi:carboxypeptidase-like regulatory domain-containing protein [Persicitalea sp.]|uniref:TonB-dependent receptor n=1 Tax=Persicitalea sp. TaxID=3100273 RepID=UPI0035932A9E
MKKRTLLSLLLVCVTTLAFAQTGSIKGTLLDAKGKEAIIGGSIVLKGTTPPVGTSTDIEGSFELRNVPTGKHTVVMSYVSYKPKEVEVTVYPNQAVVINSTLEEDVATLAEVKIVGQRATFTDVSVITEIKQAEQIAVGISAQQIQKSQDRDASQVIRRVPGVSIQDDRFVIIRGLNERYNTVMLNDAITPSTEVDVKSFSFDLIPSSAIDRMMIYKTGAPELPGEFAGGVIKIFTKTVPDENGLTVGISSSYRAGTTFQKVLNDQGFAGDMFGFGAAARKLPNSFPTTNTLLSENRPSAASFQAFRNLPDFYNAENVTVNPDLRLSVGYNNKMSLGDKTLTTFNNLSYTNANQVLYRTQNRYLAFSPSAGKSEVLTAYGDQFYGNNVRLGAMSNWGLILNPNNKIEFRNLFNQISSKETTFRQGYSTENGREVENFAFRYEAKSIYTGQLSGTHDLSDATTVKWTGAFGYTHREEPDFRRFVSSRNIGSDGPFTVEIVPGANASLTRGARFYSTLNEYTSSLRADIEHRVRRKGYADNDKMDIKLRAGAYGEYKDRTFQARWFNLTNPGGVSQEILNQPFDGLFSPSTIAADKLYYGERTNFDDRYDAQSVLAAGYVGVYYPITPKFNTSLGFRAEFNRQTLQSQLRGSGNDVDVDNPIFRPLPSVNLTYNLTDKSLFRLAYGMTLNRPEFRELAPFVYYDFGFDVSRIGNPDLKTPTIQNADFRYEFYPSDGEVISLAGFYKHFRNPIETKVRYAGSGVMFTVDNAEQAYALGAELEIRKSLKSLTTSGFVDNLTLLLNASLIKSQVTTGFAGQDNNRPLQGQSPYLVNTGIYYNNVNRGWQVNVLYNVIGERIFLVGDQEVQPTVYEMPRNVIDLNIIKTLGEHLQLKIGVQDLLNQPFRMIQDSNLDQKITDVDETYQKYRPGTYSTVGLSYKF